MESCTTQRSGGQYKHRLPMFIARRLILLAGLTVVALCAIPTKRDTVPQADLHRSIRALEQEHLERLNKDKQAPQLMWRQ